MPELPPGITEQEYAAHNKRTQAIEAAASVPAPGPLLDAMAPMPKVVCGYKLRPVEMEDVLFLQRIESPLMTLGSLPKDEGSDGENLFDKLLALLMQERPGDTKGEATARLFQGAIESFFIFTQPPKRIRNLLRDGRTAFEDAAMEELSARLGPADLGKVAAAVAEHFASGFSTAVNYEAGGGNGDGSFRSPQARTATV